MKAPGKPEEIYSWLKCARKAIDEIPKEGFGWQIDKWNATERQVVIELWNGKDKHHRDYDFAHIVIDRKASSLG